MSDFSNLVNEITGSAEQAFDYVSHPKERVDEIKKASKNVKNYGQQTLLNPMKPITDVRKQASVFLDDLVSDSTHKFLFFAGIIYFVLSHKHFKSFFDSIFLSIPIINKVYIFPHIANTLLFLLLLYIVRFKLDNDIKLGIKKVSAFINVN
jgi:hypothetical protein